MTEDEKNPYDLNGQSFESDLYFNKLLKECTLRQIMDQESEIVKDTQNLHSEMQTLVYENYNKFISATDTVRKMKTDFKKMEDEMDLLASNMDKITSFSEQISTTLQDTRQKISKLSSIHSLLKRLQFLFKLPNKLKKTIEQKNYRQAVDDYLQAQRVLQQYGNMASFQSIQEECVVIVVELKQKLRDQFKSNHATAQNLADSVDLLLQLGEPADKLCTEFLSCTEHRLSEQLLLLKDLSEQKDIIEFVDLGNSGFLSDLSLVVASYNDMFLKHSNLESIYNDNFDANAHLNTFVANNMKQYFNIIQIRVDMEQDVGNTVLLVKALDRFHRRLQAMNTLCKENDFIKQGMEIIIKAGHKQCEAHLQSLESYVTETLIAIKQTILAPKLISQDNDSSSNLSELLSSLINNNIEKIKGILQDLLVFMRPEITFSMKPQFRETFCINYVREGLIVDFLRYLISVTQSYYDSHSGSDLKFPPTLLLLLSKMCLEFQNNTIHYLLYQTDELFEISKYNSSSLTNEAELCKTMRKSAQELLNSYVRIQGHNVSQMLRKSVETRDWLHTIEPRNVRAVMKRVVEDIAAVDSTVGYLFEDGIRTEHSSDSSRKTHSISVSRHQYRSNWSSYTPNNLDSSIVSNIHKLFSERIEIFSNVEFSKNSILTGIIKISLKTFLECVRLKTFSKYGLQQIQVDTHYLQLYLWRFVADENLVHFLLDEILGSAVHRCLEPVLMEPSVVEIICERG